jgi:hypothetical protein
MHLPEFTDLAELDAKAPGVFEGGLGWAQVQYVSIWFLKYPMEYCYIWGDWAISA